MGSAGGADCFSPALRRASALASSTSSRSMDDDSEWARPSHDTPRSENTDDTGDPFRSGAPRPGLVLGLRLGLGLGYVAAMLGCTLPTKRPGAGAIRRGGGGGGGGGGGKCSCASCGGAGDATGLACTPALPGLI